MSTSFWGFRDTFTNKQPICLHLGFPSEKGKIIPLFFSGKETTCDAGDAGSIPGSTKTPEENMAIHSSITVCKIHGHESLASYSPQGHRVLYT